MAADGDIAPAQRHGGEAADLEAEAPTESSPLIPRGERAAEEDQIEKQPKRRRWPSLLALLLLCIAVALIIVCAFVAPSAVEQYASQAIVFEPTALSIDSFTGSGVRARIQGELTMDASRVPKKSVRDIGRFCTWIARAVQSGESDLKVSLPEYGNVVLGTAHVPPITLNIRAGHTNHIDFLTDLEPGEIDGIRAIANDWVEGRLGQLRVKGTADVPIKSGIFNFGTQTVVHDLLIAGDDIPTMPAYDIKKLNFRESDLTEGMLADVKLVVQNPYPVEFTVPPLGFEILVDNCEKDEPYIKLAQAFTKNIDISPKEEISVNVAGFVRQLPETLTQDCPGSKKSPLDILLGKYIHGEENTVYVQGADAPTSDTPSWIVDLMKDITVPVPIPGRTFGHLIKNFSLADTHFSLPNPLAEPDSDEANPQISAKVRALVAMLEEMNFNISVGRVRADAEVFYKGKKMGTLDLHRWQHANSTRLEPAKDGNDTSPSLLVESLVKDAPVHITDDDVFTDVIQQLIFGAKGVVMHIKAEVDVEVQTALGEFAIRRIPAEGEVPIKPIAKTPSTSPPSDGHPGNNTSPQLPSGFKPKIADLRIIDTTPHSLTLNALINVTNPTDYSASIPYANIHILKNSTLLGHATVRNLTITPGRNGNLNVTALYDPLSFGGENARKVGKELLSQYISGWNTTITVQAHKDTFGKAQQSLGEALSKFPVEIAAPRLTPDPNDADGDKDGEGEHFMSDATFHLFSSTATFLLRSPLRHSTLYVTSVDATALYPRDPDPSDPSAPIEYDDVGSIEYDSPFAVPPVADTPNREGAKTPALPVDWSLGSVGYDAVRKALGGRLRLAAKANVGVRIDNWEEVVWFQGQGIGAKVRL